MSDLEIALELSLMEEAERQHRNLSTSAPTAAGALARDRLPSRQQAPFLQKTDYELAWELSLMEGTDNHCNYYHHQPQQQQQAETRAVASGRNSNNNATTAKSDFDLAWEISMSEEDKGDVSEYNNRPAACYKSDFEVAQEVARLDDVAAQISSTAADVDDFQIAWSCQQEQGSQRTPRAAPKKRRKKQVFRCFICLDDKVSVAKKYCLDTCGHAFCAECLQRVVSGSNNARISCP